MEEVRAHGALSEILNEVEATLRAALAAHPKAQPAHAPILEVGRHNRPEDQVIYAVLMAASSANAPPTLTAQMIADALSAGRADIECPPDPETVDRQLALDEALEQATAALPTVDEREDVYCSVRGGHLRTLVDAAMQESKT